MTTITIKVWLDSGANAYSCYKSEFEIEKAEWDALSEEDKEAYAKDYAWDRVDWGFKEEEKTE